MNREVGLVVVIVAVIGLGGGAATITWLRARQAPENMALGNDRGRADEDQEQADPHGHGPEQDGTGEDDHAGHDDEDRNGHGSEDSPGHDEHEAEGGHDDGGGESGVQLSAEERKRFGVEVAVAGPGALATRISLPEEIVLNADRVAHIVPRAPGIVREVFKSVGDTVRAGETMAWLESAELGEAKVDYLAKGAALSGSTVDLTRAQEVRDNTVRFLEVLNSNPSLETLRDTNGRAMGQNRSILVSAYAEFVYFKAAYEREKPLLEKKVASERDFEAAEAEYKKADALYIATRDSIAFKVRRDLLEAERAHQVREIELKGARGRLYVLGLTSEEIAELEVHTQPQPSPATQQAGSKAGPDAPEAEGKLAWYPLRAPFDGRVIERHLTLGEKHSDDAGAFTVVDATEGFKPMPVSLGRGNASHVEVLSGLVAGQRYVTQGAFELKARIVTSGLDAHAGHGH